MLKLKDCCSGKLLKKAKAEEVEKVPKCHPERSEACPMQAGISALVKLFRFKTVKEILHFASLHSERQMH